ncbi:hypothetical protein LZ32DRAFT_230401 [Colletotrichum eremochloae]|nr:hypothetical protein LZ32DRAFT_230401 [Colletotrichum eremochloae]
MPQLQDVEMIDCRSTNIFDTGTGVVAMDNRSNRLPKSMSRPNFGVLSTSIPNRQDEAENFDAAGISSSSHPKSASKYDMHQELPFYAYALANAAPTACIQIGLRPSSARSLPRMKLHCLEATQKGGIANATLSDTTSWFTARPPTPSLGRLSGRQCESTFGLW